MLQARTPPNGQPVGLNTRCRDQAGSAIVIDVRSAPAGASALGQLGRTTHLPEGTPMLQFLVTLQSFLVADRVQTSDDRGATAVEYALMVALIAVAIIAAVIALGNKLITVFGDIATAI